MLKTIQAVNMHRPKSGYKREDIEGCLSILMNSCKVRMAEGSDDTVDGTRPRF